MNQCFSRSKFVDRSKIVPEDFIESIFCNDRFYTPERCHFLHLREGIPQCFQQNCLHSQVERKLIFKMAIFNFPLHSLFFCQFTFHHGVLITMSRKSCTVIIDVSLQCNRMQCYCIVGRAPCNVEIYDVKMFARRQI